MGSFFLTSKKASATLVFLVISIIIVSSGVIIVHEVEKSNNENNIAGTGLVLLGNEQNNLDALSDSSDDRTKLFTFGDLGGESSSKKKSSSSKSSSMGSLDMIENQPTPIDNETSDNQTFVNDTEEEDLNSSESTNNSNESNSTIEIMAKGACKQDSKETNEGPGGEYCTYDDYEECYDYRTKSTVIAYDCELIPPGCFEYERGTDYCSDSHTLQEAYLNCGFTVLTADRVKWKEKNCNDYDTESDWIYYCTGNQVRKKKYVYNYGCSDGACRLISGAWLYDTLVSQKGLSDYCSKRKEGYDNGWAYCSLCGYEDYDCDSDSQCSGSLVCTGPWPDPPFGGDWDGCCNPGESWDSTNNRCCECDSVSDCCDGCNYRSSTYVCDSHYGSYYYHCPDGQCLGDDVKRRDRKRYCSSTSSACTGLIYWNSWEIYDSCGSNEFCDSDNAGYNTPFSCSTAQCPSGVCCDTTCGEYTFFPSTKPCALGADYTCLNGEGTSYPGSDVYMRLKTAYCSGSSFDCDGSVVPSGDWSLYADCTSNQYCVEGDSYCHNCGYHTHWACHDNDVYWYDDCNNQEDPKEECGIPGCSNGQCNPAIACYNDSDCNDSNQYTEDICNDAGTPQSSCSHLPIACIVDIDCGEDGPIGDPWCSDDDVWQSYINYTCNYPGQVSAYCSNSTVSNLTDPCGEDTYNDNYCYDDDVYQNFTDRGCLDGVCFENTTAQFVQECGDEGCLNGECLYVECYNDSECDDDYYVGDSFCQEGDVWQNYVNYTCNYPGTGNSYCSNSTAPELKEDCGTDYCENWGGNYCKLYDVYHEKTCHDIGCSGGDCFDNTYTEEEKVEECGISEYIGSSYCYNDDVYKDYITRTCSYSRCTASTSEKKIEDCANGCTSGRCKIKICNYGMCYYV